MHLKYVPLYRKAYPVESQELSDIVMNEDTVEQPFLRKEVEDISESLPTMWHEDENITGARKSGNSDANDPADMNESDDLSEHFHDVPSSLTNIKQKNSEVSTEKHQKGDNDGLRTIEVDSNTCKSADVDFSRDLKEGVSTTEKSDNEEGDTQELTDVFNDTVESLQRIAHPTGLYITKLFLFFLGKYYYLLYPLQTQFGEGYIVITLYFCPFFFLYYSVWFICFIEKHLKFLLHTQIANDLRVCHDFDPRSFGQVQS
eukprot:XP_019920643.1 PREDICTED: uncharacterized protein LOC105322873 isoform X2 [Crassostrea gigas]